MSLYDEPPQGRVAPPERTWHQPLSNAAASRRVWTHTIPRIPQLYDRLLRKVPSAAGLPLQHSAVEHAVVPLGCSQVGCWPQVAPQVLVGEALRLSVLHLSPPRHLRRRAGDASPSVSRSVRAAQRHRAGAAPLQLSRREETCGAGSGCCGADTAILAAPGAPAGRQQGAAHHSALT